jgi:hypothetical protein
MLTGLTHAFGLRRLAVHAEGQSSNLLWADLSLAMAFVEDLKRDCTSISPNRNFKQIIAHDSNPNHPSQRFVP